MCVACTQTWHRKWHQLRCIDSEGRYTVGGSELWCDSWSPLEFKSPPSHMTTLTDHVTQLTGSEPGVLLLSDAAPHQSVVIFLSLFLLLEFLNECRAAFLLFLALTRLL